MDDLDSLVDGLRTVSLFKNFNPHDLRTIVTGGQIRHFRAGETIFAEGEDCAGMFVLIRGQVHLCKLGPQGQINIMAIIRPVIMFNEVCVLDGGSNPVTAVAVEESLLWQVSHVSFQMLLARYSQVGLGLLRVLAMRNRELLAHYEDLSFRPVPARVPKLLLDLSRYGQQTVNRREHPISQMAGRIFTAPEVISRSLNMFKTQGLIRCSRVEIVVCQPEKLAALAQIVPQLLNP